MSLPDNTKFQRMILNRPPLSILPSVNKRIVGQNIAKNLFYGTSLFLFGSIFLYKFYVNANSGPFIQTRKAFRFQVDPYSGEVGCSFREVPNRQHQY